MKSLMQYIQGQRKGMEAHRLEKEAMKDPFLSDALDGYQAVEGNHVESIEAMRRRISRRTRSRRDSITKWSIAASLLICIGFGSYFWLNKETGLPEQAQSMAITEDEAVQLEQAPVAAPLAATPALTRSAPMRGPRPVIGEEAFREYLKKELVHPQDSACKGIAGTVLIEFHINEQGRPVNLSVKQSLCESADKEALRLIEKGPDWEGDMGAVTVPVVF